MDYRLILLFVGLGILQVVDVAMNVRTWRRIKKLDGQERHRARCFEEKLTSLEARVRALEPEPDEAPTVHAIPLSVLNKP